MPNAEHLYVDTRIPISEIEIRMNALRSKSVTPRDKRALARLGFIHLRYDGFSIEAAAEVIGISKQTGYNWQRAWNEDGLDSIFPDFAGGRTRRLSAQQLDVLINEADSRKMTTMEAKSYIFEEFGISYSEKQVHQILSSSGMKHVSRKITGIRMSEEPLSAGRMVWTRRRH